jgi:hypothetical protein
MKRVLYMPQHSPSVLPKSPPSKEEMMLCRAVPGQESVCNDLQEESWA